jgi:hypothetical protein
MTGLYDDMKVFTDREQLYSKVTHARFLAILRDKRALIVSSHRSYNNYGEFRFVTVTMRRKYPGQPAFREAITFYGNGYHEYRDITSPDWCFSVGNSGIYRNDPVMVKRSVISEIASERAGMCFDSKPTNNAFTFLADMGDDDGAYSELCMDY